MQYELNYNIYVSAGISNGVDVNFTLTWLEPVLITSKAFN